MKRVLVTGASGLLGWNICRSPSFQDWQIFGVCFTHPVSLSGVTILKRDLGDAGGTEILFQDVRPDAVIHAAAVSDPEYCEAHGPECFGLNVDASIRLAHLCRKRSIPYVFTSSDLAFDGMNPPYREEDPVSPVSLYGRQKVEAERGILEVYPDAAVCRLPLMFGIPGAGFRSILPMVKAMSEGAPLRLFVDEHRTPLHAGTAAAGVILALEKGRGILHIGGPERISRFELGKRMAEVFGQEQAVLVPSRQKEAITAAPRPPDVSLDSRKAFALGFRPPPLLDQIKASYSEFRMFNA
ncbi:MAG: NAD(P)-dependent oxidoreductase [Desulfobacteraceae bacterium]|nr:MAG: NAD(P)-dependent oxidoreductase [Desulfobacteraceae bacterium]